MSKQLDALETTINSFVALGIAFGVPFVANYVMDMDVPADKTTGLALMYFVASTAKTWVLRRRFRALDDAK